MSVEAVRADYASDNADFIEIEQGLLKAPVIFCIGNISRQLRDLLPESLHVWRLIDVDSSSLTVEIEENQFRKMMSPPLSTAALVASDEDAHSFASTCAVWLRDHGARVVPEPIVATAEKLTELVATIAGQAVALLIDQSELITAISRELSSLRMNNERLQNNFYAVESVLVRKGLQSYDLDFVNEPVDGHISVIKEATKNRVAQILPVGSHGVSAVGIHLGEAPKRGGGFLKVQIASLEDGIILDAWSVPVSELHVGWNVFGFERSLAGLPRTLELTVATSGARGEPPCLSLGAPQPIERFRVHDADNRQALADAGLALQVWVGLASVALPSWATYWSAKPRAGKGMEIPLRQEAIAPDILGFATLYNPDDARFDFEAVQVIIPERAVACHPPAHGMTIARVPGACPGGALRVSAMALVDNKQSRDVEFALVTTANGERAAGLLSGATSPAAGESFSDWIRVSPSAKKAVNAFISQPVTQWQDIFVATRMAEAGNNEFAWAKFVDLTAMSQDQV